MRKYLLPLLLLVWVTLPIADSFAEGKKWSSFVHFLVNHLPDDPFLAAGALSIPFIVYLTTPEDTERLEASEEGNQPLRGTEELQDAANYGFLLSIALLVMEELPGCD